MDSTSEHQNRRAPLPRSLRPESRLRVRRSRPSKQIRNSRSELVLLCILQAGFNLLLEDWHEGVQAPLLILIQLPERMDCLHTLLAEGYLGCKVWQLRHLRLNVGALCGDLAVQASKDCLAEAGSCIGHGQGGAALAVFGCHYDGAGILDLLVEVRNLVSRNGLAHLALGEQGQNRGASMATDHRHADVIHGKTGHLMHKLVRSNDVEGCDAHDLGRVQALLLPQLAHGWHYGVHRVHNEANHCLWAVLCTCLHDVLGNPCIDVEQIFSVLTGFSGHAGRDKDEVAALQALAGLVDGLVILVESVARHLALLVQVRQVGGDARGRDHGQGQVVNAEFGDIGIHGHQHAQRLANATRTTDHANLEVSRHVCVRGTTKSGL
mmetsp:Transcript_136842/g.324234  ORF Transcript_136842/g.324234 Transcript_136842/m.324234 type:complete len:379 (+) Transcript_136842:54-1190(+)